MVGKNAHPGSCFMHVKRGGHFSDLTQADIRSQLRFACSSSVFGSIIVMFFLIHQIIGFCNSDIEVCDDFLPNSTN